MEYEFWKEYVWENQYSAVKRNGNMSPSVFVEFFINGTGGE